MTINLDDLFKKFGWDLMIKLAVTSALASVSLTTAGPIGWIAMQLVMAFTNWLYPFFINFVKVETIQLKNEIHQKAFEVVQIKLRVVAIEKGINSDEFKKIHEEERNKFFKAVEFNFDPLVVRIGKNT